MVEFPEDKLPSISKATTDYLLEKLSIDNQLRQGLLSSDLMAHSESFRLGFIAGQAEATRIVRFLRERPDLAED